MTSQIAARKKVQGIVARVGRNVSISLCQTKTSDRYNDIIKKTGPLITIKAFPITFAPSVFQLQKIGVKEDCDVIAYTAMQDWLDAGFTLDDFNLIHPQIKINRDVYNIKNKITPFSQFGDSWLYMIVTAMKSS